MCASLAAPRRHVCVYGHNAPVDVKRMLAAAPNELRHSTEQPDVTYALADDVVATHGAEAGGSDMSIASVDDAPDDGTAGPVYRTAGGGLAIPTGRALVRFADSDRAEHHRDEIAAAGFDLEQPLSYAPQAAWVRASSGEITDTLSGLSQLEQLPGVEHVEPQLLTQAARRDA
jgi:hypothetical protein